MLYGLIEFSLGVCCPGLLEVPPTRRDFVDAKKCLVWMPF